MTRLRLTAFAIAILTWLTDFLLVQYLLGSGVTGRVLIPGLADFNPTLNRGISFSLLTQDSPAGAHWLIGVLALIVIFVAIMAWRAASLPAAIGFGLILGGALGNLLDRLLLNGAVFDFLALHLGQIQLFVCNFADILITAGVLLLLADSLLAGGDARQTPTVIPGEHER